MASVLNRLVRFPIGRRAAARKARPHRRRRGPRAAIGALATGLVVIAVAHAALLLNLHHSCYLRDPTFQRRFARFEQRLKADMPELTIVALGSSRLQYGFLGDRAEDEAREGGLKSVMFNFSCSGGGPIIGRLTLDRLLERGVRPDHVVVEVFLATFLDDKGMPFEWITIPANRALPAEAEVLISYGFNPDAVKQAQRVAETQPWGAFRNEIFDRIYPKLATPGTLVQVSRSFDNWGSHPVDGENYPQSQRELGAARMREDYTACLATGVLSPHAVRALEDLLARCRERKIGVTVVLMPEAGWFRALYSPQLLEQGRVMLARLAAEYGVAVADAREWVADDQFIDGHHLFQHGADRFTRRLCREFVLLRVTSPAQTD